MNYEHVKDLLGSEAILIFRYELLPLAVTVLYREFKLEPGSGLGVDYLDLRDKVDSLLQTLRVIEANPERFQKNSDELLKDWEKRRLIQIDQRAGKYEVRLTVQSQRLFRWLEDIEQRTFVASESRLATLYHHVQEVITMTSQDPEEQIAFLQSQIDDINKRIDEIRASNEPLAYSPHRLAGRLQEIDENGRQLITDMTVFLSGFEQLTERMMEQELQPEMHRGLILGEALNEYDVLRNTVEGASFYAFRDFLIYQVSDELHGMLEQLIGSQWGGYLSHSSVLRDLIPTLVGVTNELVASNSRFIQQLRYLLDVDMARERLAIQALIREIKILAKPVAKVRKVDRLGRDFFSLPGEVRVSLLMERPWFDRTIETFNTERPVEATLDLNIDVLGLIVNAFRIDHQRLNENIEFGLKREGCITLGDLVRLRPIEQGISELYAYFAIGMANPQHRVDMEQYEEVAIEYEPDQPAKLIRAPLLVFYGDGANVG